MQRFVDFHVESYVCLKLLTDLYVIHRVKRFRVTFHAVLLPCELVLSVSSLLLSTVLVAHHLF